MCGLWFIHRKSVILIHGSSPRVRAVARQNVRHCRNQRFIPACAGCGVRVSIFFKLFTVHPRVCGLWDTTDFIMSPNVRFIPACAGCGFKNYFLVSFVAVHPRVCGLWIQKLFFGFVRCGSSPRVRAVVSSGCSHEPFRRFIPACAGCGLFLKYCHR